MPWGLGARSENHALSNAHRTLKLNTRRLFLMKLYAPKVAFAIVVANMVGTGVFTSLGFQLLGLSDTRVILLLWLIGGICALCGALCYAELGVRHPDSGGEYHFLTELIHPYAGFISGFVSATVGFAAPIALAALTFGSYLQAGLLPVDPKLSATALIVALVVIHTRTRRESSAGQVYLTALKLLLITGFIGLALLNSPAFAPQLFTGAPLSSVDMISNEAAIALIYVTYAYSGWNAATYVLGEMEDPRRHLPRVLLAGCGFVTLLYLALNAVFLISAPVDAMRGEVEIGYVVAGYLLGNTGASVVAVILAGVLISTVSAMVLAGPRALMRLGVDYPRFKWLGALNDDGLPKNAVMFMGIIALVFLWSSTFEQILIFAGLLMAANTFITVVALFISRKRTQGQLDRSLYTMPLYPLPALLFLGITGWTLIYSAVSFPTQVGVFAIALIAGWPLYRWTRQ